MRKEREIYIYIYIYIYTQLWAKLYLLPEKEKKSEYINKQTKKKMKSEFFFL